MGDRASNIGHNAVSEQLAGPCQPGLITFSNLPDPPALSPAPLSLLEAAEYGAANMRDLAASSREIATRLCGIEETKMPDAVKPKSQDFATRMRDAVQEIDALRYRIAEDLSRIDSALR